VWEVAEVSQEASNSWKENLECDGKQMINEESSSMTKIHLP
jgi:hypothetical protein